jgi:hypothetical protein
MIKLRPCSSSRRTYVISGMGPRPHCPLQIGSGSIPSQPSKLLESSTAGFLARQARAGKKGAHFLSLSFSRAWLPRAKNPDLERKSATPDQGWSASAEFSREHRAMQIQTGHVTVTLLAVFPPGDTLMHPRYWLVPNIASLGVDA